MSDSRPPLLDSLSKARSPQDFHGALRKELTAFDRLQDTILEKNGTKLACRKGCGICCNLRVDVRPPEIFLLAEHIRTRFTPTEQSELLVKLEAHSKLVTSLTPLQHVTRNIQCAMLKEGSCSVHVARPHSCRRYHSKDYSTCEYVYANPMDLNYPGARDNEVFRTLGEAMALNAEAYDALGYDSQIYELGSALYEALTSPSAWRRWKDGKKAFLTASVTPSE